MLIVRKFAYLTNNNGGGDSGDGSKWSRDPQLVEEACEADYRPYEYLDQRKFENKENTVQQVTHQHGSHHRNVTALISIIIRYSW